MPLDSRRNRSPPPVRISPSMPCTRLQFASSSCIRLEREIQHRPARRRILDGQFRVAGRRSHSQDILAVRLTNSRRPRPFIAADRSQFKKKRSSQDARTLYQLERQAFRAQGCAGARRQQTRLVARSAVCVPADLWSLSPDESTIPNVRRRTADRSLHEAYRKRFGAAGCRSERRAQL